MSAKPSHIKALSTPLRLRQYSATDVIQNGTAGIRPVSSTITDLEPLMDSDETAALLKIQSTKILDPRYEPLLRLAFKRAMSDTSFSSTTGREFQWLTASEAAIYLRIKPRTLLLSVRTGKVRGHALSGTKRRIWRFLIADLDAALLKETVLASKTLFVSAEREE